MEQLKKVGAKVIVIIAGHYGSCQVDFIKKVSNDFAAANPSIRVIARPENEGVLVDGETPGDHAGKWETSMLWSLYPDRIRWDSYDTQMSDMKIYKNAPHDYYKESADWDFGEDLRVSSSESLGRKAIDIITDTIVADIRKALDTLDHKE